MRIFVGDQHPVTNAPLGRVVVVFHGGTIDEAAEMLEEGRIRVMATPESTGFNLGDWAKNATERMKTGGKTLWDDIKGAATRNHCNICSGPHLPFQCPNRANFTTTTERKHAPGECIGSGPCRNCGARADHHCYGEI